MLFVTSVTGCVVIVACRLFAIFADCPVACPFEVLEEVFLDVLGALGFEDFLEVLPALGPPSFDSKDWRTCTQEIPYIF